MARVRTATGWTTNGSGPGLSLHAALLAVKVWSGSAYIWSGDGTAPDPTSYTNIIFVDPGGTHDPRSSTGGRNNINDLWETGATGGGGSSASGMTLNTTLKTANYTAVANEFSILDTTAGSITITLPPVPPEGTMIGTRIVIFGAGTTVTFITSGGDTFNRPGGSNIAVQLDRGSETVVYLYGGGVWIAFSLDYPPSQFPVLSTLTTKGDLYVATATSTVARQAVGPNGTVLTADNTQTNGVAWGTVGAATMPAGIVMPFAGPVAMTPSGWLTCNGVAVSRTTYADLFAVVGTSYGVGDGTTTFNLPNLNGRVLAGLDTGQTEFNAVGKTGGEKTHALTTAELASHLHVVDPPNTVTDALGNHYHGSPDGANFITTGTGGQGMAFTAAGGNMSTTNWSAQGDHAHNLNIAAFNSANAGSGTAHNNIQPYVTMPYIIKT